MVPLESRSHHRGPGGMRATGFLAPPPDTPSPRSRRDQRVGDRLLRVLDDLAGVDSEADRDCNSLEANRQNYQLVIGRWLERAGLAQMTSSGEIELQLRF